MLLYISLACMVCAFVHAALLWSLGFCVSEVLLLCRPLTSNQLALIPSNSAVSNCLPFHMAELVLTTTITTTTWSIHNRRIQFVYGRLTLNGSRDQPAWRAIYVIVQDGHCTGLLWFVFLFSLNRICNQWLDTRSMVLTIISNYSKPDIMMAANYRIKIPGIWSFRLPISERCMSRSLKKLFESTMIWWPHNIANLNVMRISFFRKIDTKNISDSTMCFRSDHSNRKYLFSNHDYHNFVCISIVINRVYGTNLRNKNRW